MPNELKLFLVTFSYAPSAMQSGVFAHFSKEQLEDDIENKYSKWDEDDKDWYEKFIPVDHKPEGQHELGYDKVQFQVKEIEVDLPGLIHMAYSCC